VRIGHYRPNLEVQLPGFNVWSAGESRPSISVNGLAL
jgi:hypothetical protein